MNTTKLRDLMDYSWWLIPLLMALGAVVLALGVIILDGEVEDAPSALAFPGGPDAARTVLSTMNSGVLTFTALTFSITVVILVLTSGQFSPRVLRTFLHDRMSQFSLGLFVGTYVYILTVLREVRDVIGDRGAFVPRMGVTLGFALTAASILMFVFYVHHIAHTVRAATIINRIADDTRRAIIRLYPEPEAGDRHSARSDVVDRVVGSDPEFVVNATRAGIYNGVKLTQLIKEAKRLDRVVVVVPRVGDFVRTHQTLLEVHRGSNRGSDGAGHGGDVDHSRLRRALILEQEASVRFDVAFGFRQLVDMAARAQSPGVNDPTTSTQCLHLMHDLLWHLAIRPFPVGEDHDDQGTVRVVRPLWTWDDYVHLAFDEIRHWGADSLQMHRHLRQILDDLLAVTDEDRRPPLEEQRRLLEERLRLDLPEVEQPVARRAADRYDASAQ